MFGRSFAGITTWLFQMALIANAMGANIVWTNVTGGDWGIASNWNPNQVPGVSDGAYLTNQGTYTVTVTTVAVASSVFVGSSTGVQTLRVAAGSLTSGNISTLTANGALT